MDLQLAGKRALITGSNSGIGRAAAEQLAREGVEVVVHGRDRERTEQVAAAIRRDGGKAHAICGAIDTAAAVIALADEATALTGGIDILINNAGGRPATHSNEFKDLDSAAWIDTLRINLLSHMEFARRLSPAMVERGWGRIVNVSSVAGSFSKAGTPPDYGASKAALNNLTLSLSVALQGTGVSVTTVSPGPILTPALEGYIQRTILSKHPEMSPAEAERHAAEKFFKVPLGLLGRAEEVAALICLLASPLGGFCHATNLHIDGGALATVN
jgi:NAD(P)-dependent dehydrogenase (short-subunit alcohol dehydrogenase family)